MDAAQIIRKFSIFTASALLLASAAMAQTPPVLQPQRTTVNLVGTSGDFFDVNSSGDPITFTVGAPQYASSDGDWLQRHTGCRHHARAAQPSTWRAAGHRRLEASHGDADALGARRRGGSHHHGDVHQRHVGRRRQQHLERAAQPARFHRPVGHCLGATGRRHLHQRRHQPTIASATPNVNWLTALVTNPAVTRPAVRAESTSPPRRWDNSAGQLHRYRNRRPRRGRRLTITVTLTVTGGSAAAGP